MALTNNSIVGKHYQMFIVQKKYYIIGHGGKNNIT